MSYADLIFDPEDLHNPEMSDYYEYQYDMMREDALIEEYEASLQ
jgi:hypothetical protein